MARLVPLFSGSSGNSYYIGSRSAGLLLDAGRSAKQLEQMMLRCGVDPLALQGILLTHEHSDHISGVRVLAKKYGLPVFGTPGTLNALGAETLSQVETHPLEEGLQLAGMTVTSFPTSHDAAQPVGYRILTEDRRTVTLCTDTGVLTQEALAALTGADAVILESNHDPEMLRLGGYPLQLKMRILSDHGHLSNAACAGVLAQLHRAGTRRFLLAHLSRENNTPGLALEAAQAALTRAGLVDGVDYWLAAAAPENVTGEPILF